MADSEGLMQRAPVGFLAAVAASGLLLPGCRTELVEPVAEVASPTGSMASFSVDLGAKLSVPPRLVQPAGLCPVCST